MRRRWPKTSRAYLVGSVALAVLAGAMLHAFVARVAAGSLAAGPGIPVVVAAQDIGRGSPVRLDQVRVVRVPQAYAQPGSFQKVSQVTGRVALADLSLGEAVTETRLARVRAGPVASLIPEGLRAFAVPTSLPPGAVTAGDRVDVLATYGSGQPHSEVVANGLQVLSVLGPSGGSAGGTGSASTGLDAAGSGASQQVTLVLLVSPDQETDLAFARAFADLEVAIEPAGGDAASG